jgi:hypothetical protein
MIFIGPQMVSNLLVAFLLKIDSHQRMSRDGYGKGITKGTQLAKERK